MWGRDTGKITEEYFAIESCIFLSLSGVEFPITCFNRIGIIPELQPN